MIVHCNNCGVTFESIYGFFPYKVGDGCPFCNSLGTLRQGYPAERVRESMNELTNLKIKSKKLELSLEVIANSETITILEIQEFARKVLKDIKEE